MKITFRLKEYSINKVRVRNGVLARNRVSLVDHVGPTFLRETQLRYVRPLNEWYFLRSKNWRLVFDCRVGVGPDRPNSEWPDLGCPRGLYICTATVEDGLLVQGEWREFSNSERLPPVGGITIVERNADGY